MSTAVGSALAALLDLGGLAAEVAQVVELRAAYVATGHDLDLLEDRGVDREGALDADAEGDLADREGPADARALDSDHDALEHLDAGAVALDDLDVDLDGVAGAEGGDVVAQRGGGQRVDDVGHDSPRECHRSAADDGGSVWCPSLDGLALRPLWQVLTRIPEGVRSGRSWPTGPRSKSARERARNGNRGSAGQAPV